MMAYFIILHLVCVAIHFPRKVSGFHFAKDSAWQGNGSAHRALRLSQDFLPMSEFLFHLKLLASLRHLN